MLDYSRFDRIAREVIEYSEEEARALKADAVGTHHILLAALKRTDTEIINVLARYGLDYNRFYNALVDIVGIGDSERVNGTTPSFRRVVTRDVKRLAALMRENMVTLDVLVTAAISDNTDITDMVLRSLDFDKRLFIRNMLNPGDEDMGPDGPNMSDEEIFENYTTNLNERAKSGEIDPVIGREKEISRMIEILSRRTKNNPTLIGEPGVGKTAVVEGLAERIVSGDVPFYLKDKIVYKVDLTMLVAGTKYRGDFEDRIKKLLERAKSDDTVILFIDEIHNIVGAGGSEGSLDASNILKPYLERGDIQIIGATTFDEYRKYIEKDSALERRLQTITVEEPTVEETIKILKGIRKKFEEYHRVKITDEALIEAVTLSERYLTERFLPDKAIDVMDEAMSKKRTKVKGEDSSKILKEQLESIIEEKKAAVLKQDFLCAARLRDEERVVEDKISKDSLEASNKYEVVDNSVIEEVVSTWSGVPVSQMTDNELLKLRNFEKNLSDKVIGQGEAISVIDRAIKRSKVGLKDPNRPIGSFLFVGPTGVGKTYLAKRISFELFGDENKMTVVDMSEFMEKHSVSKLIGSPPGYVGYEEGGRLTESVRKNPYQVILFDEIEKAHPDIFNALLQILEEGRLTDSKGKVVDFKNTVIIMTSNAGTSDLKKKNTYGFGGGEETENEAIKGKVEKALKEMFKPEFLNRVDEIVVFNTLNQESVKKIVNLEIEKIKSRIKDKYELEVTDDFLTHVAKEGYSDTYGARPIKRVLMKSLEDVISEEIVRGQIKPGDKVVLDFKDKVVVNKE